jgi:hypothetical protein
MSYIPPSSQAAPARKRGAMPYLAAGCALIGLCVLCAAAVGGGFYFYTQRPVASAGVPSVEYILDATQRMALQAEGENDTRLNVARGVLAEIVRPSDPTVTAGLRVFGSGAQPAACNDTALLVPLAPASQVQISGHLLAVTTGANPAAAMAQAMISAIRDLVPIKGKHTLVVVTGGADSCNPQAGELIASEAQKAGIELQLFMVGFQVTEGDGNAIKGLVDSAGGTYIKADNKQKLTEVIGAIQQYVQDQKATTVSSVLGTAVAVVGTENVVAQGTPHPAGTVVPGNVVTPVAPTVAVTQGGASGGAIGQTACDHPYFPLRPGSTWTFDTDQGTVTWTVTGVTGDKTDATADMDYHQKDVTGKYHWHCTPDGIVSYDFGNLTTSAGNPANLQVTQSSGVWLPSPDKLHAGASWTNSYTIKGSDTSGGTGITISETFDQVFNLIGVEKQDVAGQSHDALRIESTGTVKVEGGVAGMTLNTSTTYWLVSGIGLVHTESQFQSVTGHSTLTSYSIP